MDSEKREGIPDDFDSFVMTTRATPDDVAELASYLYTNSQVKIYICETYELLKNLFGRTNDSATNISIVFLNSGLCHFGLENGIKNHMGSN